MGEDKGQKEEEQQHPVDIYWHSYSCSYLNAFPLFFVWFINCIIQDFFFTITISFTILLFTNLNRLKKQDN